MLGACGPRSREGLIMSSWTRVPHDVARLHPLYGVKGWAILPAIGLGVTPLLSLLVLIVSLSSGEAVARLPWLSSVLFIENVVQLAIGASAAILLFGLINHREWFRPGYTAYALAAAVLPFIDAIMVSTVARDHGLPLLVRDILTPGVVARSIALVAWAAYVNASVRIRVTC